MSAAPSSAARASLALVGAGWTLPFLQPYHFYPLTMFYTEWLAFAAGLAASTLLVTKRARDGLQLPVIALVPLGLVGIILLQLAAGLVAYTEQAMTAALYLLWAFALILLGDVLRREYGLEKVAAVLAWCLLAGGLLSAVVALLQHFGFGAALHPLITAKTTAALFGNLAQPNHFADYTALSVASLAFLVSTRRLRVVFALPAGAALSLVAALAGSRSVWLYCVAFVVLAVWWWRGTPGEASSRLFVSTMLFTAAFASMQWLVTLPFMQPYDGDFVTAGRRLFDDASGSSTRFVLWHDAWNMFVQSPLSGVGFGQFSWRHFLSGTGSGESAGLYNNAHNIFLQLLAELGLPGMLVFAAGAVAWCAGLRRLELRAETWWLVAVVAVLAIHSQLEFPLWYAHFLGIAALLAGVGATGFLSAGRARMGATVPIAALGLGWFVALTTLGSYRTLESALFTDATTMAQSRRNSDDLLRVHRESLLAPYVDLAIAPYLSPTRFNLPDKLKINTQVMHFVPAPQIVYGQAMLLALSGERQTAAIELWQRASVVYPAERSDYVRALEAAARQFPAPLGPLLEFAQRQSR